MPQEDQQDYYPVISFPLTSICYCTVLQTLGDELYLMPKATLIYVLKKYIFLCHALPENCLIKLSKFFQNQVVTKYILFEIHI